jgi:hypothetical protein
MSKSIQTFVNEYAGDLAWDNYVSALGIKKCWPTPRDELRAVIVHKMGNNESRAGVWYEKQIPALNGETPSQILNESDGLIAIRCLVMRMP